MPIILVGIDECLINKGNKYMEFYNSITNYAIAQEMDRICKSNATSYPVRDKAARVNDALDRYLHLAFQADGNWNFDDINETSPPIDTQAIVSGTNRYKFSAFTQTLLSLIRLEILDSAGKGLSLIPETMADLNQVSLGNETGRISGVGTDTFQERYVNATSGVPTHYIKYGDFIYLRPNPNYSLAAALLAYFNRPASKFDFNTFTVTIAAPGVVTLAAHGLAINDTVLLQTDGALPTGLSVNTVYYVVATVATNTFSLALTKGGTAITTSGSQSGVHYLVETSKVPGIPEIHHPYLAKHASLPYLIENNKEQVNAVAQQIRIDELAIQEYFARRDKDTVHGLRARQENNK